jgi:signal transduction histidine kinase
MQAALTIPPSGSAAPAAPGDAGEGSGHPRAHRYAGVLRRSVCIGTFAACLALLAALVFLVLKTNQKQYDYDEIAKSVRELKQLDVRWQADLLSVVMGLGNNYDTVTAVLPVMSSRFKDLEQRVKLLVEENPAAAQLPQLLAQQRRLLDDKMALAEQVKSQHAVLVNSSRFLPMGSVEVMEAARTSDGRSGVDAPLNALLVNMMSFLDAVDKPPEDGVRAAMSMLRQMEPQLSAEAARRIETLLMHAEVLLKGRRDSADLLTRMEAIPTEKTFDNISDSLSSLQRLAISEQHDYRQGLIAYAVVLLALLSYAGYAALRNYRKVQQTNKSLTTANAEAQVMLIQASKMSAVGQMVAGIAHEINTPLAYVKATFEVLADQLTAIADEASSDRDLGRILLGGGNRDADEDESKDDGAGEILSDIRSLISDGLHGIAQISNLVMTLKNFSRIDRAKRDDFSVEEGLESTLEIARYHLKNTVHIVKEYQDVPRVRCSPSQINQVFLNLVHNAVQAMPKREEKGVITLRTSMHDDHTVRVDIQDNGSGIPDEILPRIFDPFFTTKKVGEGTGAGLAICYRIIENHGGHIEVKSKPGVGTTFSILLPIKEHGAPTTDFTAISSAGDNPAAGRNS